MKPKKMKARLDRRVADHATLPRKLLDKAKSRYQSGGYRCPGSPKQS